jgi:hypothetical protein
MQFGRYVPIYDVTSRKTHRHIFRVHHNINYFAFKMHLIFNLPLNKQTVSLDPIIHSLPYLPQLIMLSIGAV